ncbi:MAG TPA: hypothetical protein VK989_20510 [Polyangia bacterium]|nr:hypothetical protein [Polyangia bacterium]
MGAFMSAGGVQVAMATAASVTVAASPAAGDDLPPHATFIATIATIGITRLDIGPVLIDSSQAERRRRFVDAGVSSKAEVVA